MSSIGAKPIPIPKDLSFILQTETKVLVSKKDLFFYSTNPNSETWRIEIKGNFNSIEEKIPKSFGLRFFIQEPTKFLENPQNISANFAKSLKLEKVYENLSKDLQKKSKKEERIFLKKTNILWGSLRQKLASTLEGASQGLSLDLHLSGLGFKAFKEEKNSLLLKLGFSHTLKLELPSTIEFKIGSDSPSSREGQKIILKSSNKQILHSIADQIAKLKSPEPYKGKGIIIQKPQLLQKLKLQKKQGKKKSN